MGSRSGSRSLPCWLELARLDPGHSREAGNRIDDNPGFAARSLFLWRQYYAFALSFYMERIAGPQPKAADGAWNHHLSLG